MKKEARKGLMTWLWGGGFVLLLSLVAGAAVDHHRLGLLEKEVKELKELVQIVIKTQRDVEWIKKLLEERL